MLEKMKAKHIKCELNDLLDVEYLMNNVPWENYNRGDRHVFYIPEPSTLYYTNSFHDEIKETIFDSVYITGFNGYGGTQYSFIFMLRDEEVAFMDNSSGIFGYDREKVKETAINHLNKLINRKEEEILELKEIIKKHNL
jgi:hypothetical protein